MDVLRADSPGVTEGCDARAVHVIGMTQSAHE